MRNRAKARNSSHSENRGICGTASSTQIQSPARAHPQAEMLLKIVKLLPIHWKPGNSWKDTKLVLPGGKLGKPNFKVRRLRPFVEDPIVVRGLNPKRVIVPKLPRKLSKRFREKFPDSPISLDFESGVRQSLANKDSSKKRFALYEYSNYNSSWFAHTHRYYKSMIARSDVQIWGKGVLLIKTPGKYIPSTFSRYFDHLWDRWYVRKRNLPSGKLYKLAKLMDSGAVQVLSYFGHLFPFLRNSKKASTISNAWRQEETMNRLSPIFATAIGALFIT